MKVTNYSKKKKSNFITPLVHSFQTKIKILSKSKVIFLRMSNEVDQQPTQMQCQFMVRETSSAIQEHNVDFGQTLRKVCPNIQGGADFSFFFPRQQDASNEIFFCKSPSYECLFSDEIVKENKNFHEFSWTLNQIHFYKYPGSGLKEIRKWDG